MTVQDHCHLQALTANAEDDKFHIRMGTLDDTPIVPLVVDRALDSTLLYHRVLDNNGVPVVIDNKSMVIFCTSRAEVDALIALVARPIYFIPIDHADDGNTSGHTAARKQIVMAIRPGTVTNIDPACQYWQVGIELTDND